MDLTLAFNIAISVIAFLGGWLLKTLFERITALEDVDRSIASELAELRVELPSHYVRKDEFRQLGDSIFEALRRIEDKLDRKVDKP